MKKIFKIFLIITFFAFTINALNVKAEVLNENETNAQGIESEGEDQITSSEIIDPVLNEVFDIVPVEEISNENEVSESIVEVVPVKAPKASSYNLTVNYIDTRLDNMDIQTNTYASGSSSSSIRMNTYLGLSSTTANYINEKDSEGNDTYYTYVFEGWFTEDGRKLDYTDYTDVDGVSIKIYNKSQYSTLSVKVPTLEENKEINLYARWTKYYKPLVTVHVYDTKRFRENNEVYSKTTRLSLTGTSGVAYMLKLDQLFDNNDSIYSAFSYTGTYDKNIMAVSVKNNSPVYFKFIKWMDEKGTKLDENYIDPNMVYEEDYKNVISKVELIDKKVGNIDRKQMLSITAKSAKDANIDKDIDINIYVDWEGHTSANLSNEYIDEVSTGTGSWSTESGGLIDYNHTFSDPSIKTPTPHYEFLYWQFIDSDPVDDQVDPTKEYKDGDVFTYDLFNKPENWRGNATAYAWWKADITLNLYDGTELLGSNSKFDSIGINDVLESNPTKYGYTFIGWVDKDGTLVNETTFTANAKGTNPEPKTIDLYAKWEQVQITISISKEWDDENNEDEIRPDSVTVYLYADGQKIKDIDITAEDGWNVSITLPKYNSTSEIEYTLVECEVEYYESSVTGSAEKGFIVKNFHEVGGKGEGEDPDEPTPAEPVNEDISDNPKTGDNIIMNIMVLLISALGLAGTLYLRKYNF